MLVTYRCTRVYMLAAALLNYTLYFTVPPFATAALTIPLPTCYLYAVRAATAPCGICAIPLPVVTSLAITPFGSPVLLVYVVHIRRLA